MTDESAFEFFGERLIFIRFAPKPFFRVGAGEAI